MPKQGPPVSSWNCDAVVEFLNDIGLGHLAAGFKENAVDGKDLLGLSDDDLREELKCTNLQVRTALGVHGTMSEL